MYNHWYYSTWRLLSAFNKWGHRSPDRLTRTTVLEPRRGPSHLSSLGGRPSPLLLGAQAQNTPGHPPSILLALDTSKRDQGSRPTMPQPWPLNWDKAAWQLGQPGLAFSPFGVKGWETNVSPPLEGRLRLQTITPAHQSPVYGTAMAIGRQAFGLQEPQTH